MENPDESIEYLLSEAVKGSAACVSILSGVDHKKLLGASLAVGSLYVSRSALSTVMADWIQGVISDEDVQRWASFVRRGYISGAASGPITAIQIDYEEHDELLIVDIVARLDEIGDLIDGIIDFDEKREIFFKLNGG